MGRECYLSVKRGSVKNCMHVICIITVPIVTALLLMLQWVVFPLKIQPLNFLVKKLAVKFILVY